MNIFFNKIPINGPYGGGNIILRLLVDYCQDKGHNTFFDLNVKPDVSFIFDSRENLSTESFLDIKNKSGVVIQRINDNDKHRNMIGNKDQAQVKTSQFASGIIYISKWIKDYFNLAKNGVVIHNSCDRKLFTPSVDLNIDKLRIITHHWSNNENKGFEVYRQLALLASTYKDIEFNFMGNAPKDFDCLKLIAPQKYTDIPFYLRQSNVYVSASRYEAGGCHLVEGMGCGLYPIVERLGGGTTEYLDGYGDVFSSFEELKEKILLLRSNKNLLKSKIENVRNNYIYDSEDMCSQYLEFATSIL